MHILGKLTALLLWLMLVLPGNGIAQPPPGKFYLVGLGPAGPDRDEAMSRQLSEEDVIRLVQSLSAGTGSPGLRVGIGDDAAVLDHPGGRLVVLDLVKHNFEQAHELYADLWLGFTEVELRRYFKGAGFHRIETATVDREAEPPHFQTLLGIAVK